MSDSTQNLSWIVELSDNNLLKLYDVTLDIYEAMQIQDTIVIPLYQPRIKWPVLLPMDGIGWRDEYCQGRCDALSFLKGKGIISEFQILHALQRWDSKIKVIPEDKRIAETEAIMKDEFKKRFHPKGTEKDESVKKEEISVPEKITVPWIFKNVSWEVWIEFAGIVFGAFIVGIMLGQLSFVRELIKIFFLIRTGEG